MTYTSGTTGRPKGIARPAPPPARDDAAEPLRQRSGGSAPTTCTSCAGPAYHTAPSAYAPDVAGRGWHRGDHGALRRHRVPPAHRGRAGHDRRRWCRPTSSASSRPTGSAYDRSSVRKVLHAAAPCPVPVKRRIIEVFPPGTVWEFYGASEGMASVISPEEWLAKPGSVGRPFPGLSVRILDDDGNELPTGEVGALYISSFAGQRFEYHNAPDKTDAAWQGDYFTVGDLGWVDEDGYVFLADRRTDLILVGRRQRLPGRGRDGADRGRRRGRRGGVRAARRAHGPAGPRRGRAAPRRAPRRRRPVGPAGRPAGRLQAAPDHRVRRRAATRAQRQGAEDQTARRAMEPAPAGGGETT